MSEATNEVRKALFMAQRDVGGIGKDSTAKIVGKSKDGGRVEYSYKFTSTEDMLEHCRHALHEHGLSWEMTGWDVLPPLPGFGCPTLVCTFELCHGESGQVLDRTYKMPIASRNDADKATSGAITYLLGQATRTLLLVPKVSEEESKNTPDQRTENHGGWEQRGTQRSVTLAARREPVAPHERERVEATPDTGVPNVEELRARAEKLSMKLKGYTQWSLATQRSRAKVSKSGSLSPEELVLFVRWCTTELRNHEDPEPGDDFSQDGPSWALTSEEGGQS